MKSQGAGGNGAGLPPSSEFLQLVSEDQRVTVGQWFRAAADQARDAGDLLRRVGWRATDRCLAEFALGARRPAAVEAERLRDALRRAVQDHRPEALAYANEMLRRAQLPAEERIREREERGEHYRREAMAAKPATEKQLSYLKALGFSGPAPANRAAASQLIDEIQKAIRERVDVLDAELDQRLRQGPEGAR